MFCFFRRGIVPEKCSHIVKKKSIEINLEKASQTNWGSLGVKCRTTLASPVKSSMGSGNMGNFGGGGGGSSFMSGSSNSSNSNSIYFKSPIATFSPNQWTPFATAAAAAATATGSSNSSSSDGSDSLMGLDSLYGSGSGGPSSNSLALVTYEEPVGMCYRCCFPYRYYERSQLLTFVLCRQNRYSSSTTPPLGASSTATRAWTTWATPAS